MFQEFMADVVSFAFKPFKQNTTLMIDRMHLGARVKHLREFRQITSRDMAKRLEMDHVQYINDVEGTEQIADYLLDKIGVELDFPMEYIRDWMENPINITQNNNDSVTVNGGIQNGYSNSIVNPLDKVVELYERLLKIEQEKVELLQKQKESGNAS